MRRQEFPPRGSGRGSVLHRAVFLQAFCAPRLRGESLVLALDQQGIALSSGSACKSGSPEPTHVLIAMGRTETEAHCSVRFSLSHNTTEEDISETVSALAQVLEEKSIVRLVSCK
ncbi:MAG: aminotransferase class V-fold PLP-dependent enzyme [Candidatus Hydrogenedentes bacterium]|nr:aminotransferase class V-fold PLP-dependent enzyme [Candidatus Hydrogenedentota bacterium]